MGNAATGTKAESSNQSFQPFWLKVATLNYSGILLSPYEFYEKGNDRLTKELNENMKSILRRQCLSQKITKIEQIKFDLGEFDKNWQKGRFSPIYEPLCGIKKGSLFLMNKKEFESEWNKCRDKNKQQLKSIHQNYLREHSNKPIDQNKCLDNCRKFDCMLYEAILKSVYGENKELQKFDKQGEIFSLRNTEYLTHRKDKFSKKFLSEKFKIERAIQMIEKLKIDILFVQEVSKEFIQTIEKHLKGFHVCKGQRDSLCKSAIIIRLQKFKKAQSLVIQNSRFLNNVINLRKDQSGRKYLKDLKSDLNFNDDTVIQFIYNIILICPHLTSKKKKPNEKEDGSKQANQHQIIKLNNAIIRLKYVFPDCHIIVGGDLNNENYKVEDNTVPIPQEGEKDSPNNNKKQTANKMRLEDFPLKTDPPPKTDPPLKTDPPPKTDPPCLFNVFPKPKNFTSFKKRTFLQAQPSKAEKEIRQIKDYIITDMQIDPKESKVILFGDAQKPQQIIDVSKKSKEQLSYLPTNEHPYDHFLVYAELKVQKQLEHVSQVKYLSKYEPGRLTSEDYNSFEEAGEKKQEGQK